MRIIILLRSRRHHDPDADEHTNHQREADDFPQDEPDFSPSAGRAAGHESTFELFVG